MIFYIQNGVVAIVDYDTFVTVDTATLHLEVTLPFHDLQYEMTNPVPSFDNIKSLSYEEGRGLYHVVTSDEKVLAYDFPEQHYFLKWIKDNKDELMQVGIELRQIEMGVPV